MLRSLRIPFVAFATSILAVSLTGCDGGLRNYVHNGFKVGPNYCQPDAPVAEHWINEKDVHVEENPEILRKWWTVFKDPKLNELIATASHQNLKLREAGFRVLQARYTLAIKRGDLFPQTQQAVGSYSRNATEVNQNSPIANLNRYTDSWDFGFNMQWELDFWGRFRRAIASAEDSLDAWVYDYDYVMVTMLGDIAKNYVTVRTTEEQIRLAQANVVLQRDVADWVRKRVMAGYKQAQLDLDQAVGTLRATEATVPTLEITRQQAEDALCVLMGIPTVDLRSMLGESPIPPAPVNAIVGIPADLLRRRPDVREAERNAAAQAEQIGIAKSDLYPAFYVDGSLGYTAANFPDLFRNTAFNGSIGPSFQWNVLNYGRIVNNVRFQDANFQQLVATYQQSVLTANQEVEDGMATYLRSQQQAKLLDESVTADTDAVRIAIVRYKIGSIDFNTYVTIAQNLVVQQNAAAQARGQIAQGLIAVYRALGGGWELKNEEESSGEPAAMETAPSRAEEEEAEQMPAPLPTVPEEPTAIKKPDAAKEPVPSKETDAAKKSDATEKSAEPKKPADEKSEPAVKEGTNALKIDNVLNEPSAES